MSRLWNLFLKLFIKPKYELWITYKPTDWEGKKETHKFIVRKRIKITPKHIIFNLITEQKDSAFSSWPP